MKNTDATETAYKNGYEQGKKDALAKDNNVPSKWIPVSERLPTFYDADADNCVLAIHKASNKRYYHWRSVADNPFDFTCWMTTPQPPKGE